MSFVTYPLNNIDYVAEDAELFHVTRTSGIYAENSFSISVSGADNIVTIGKGIAWIKNGEFSGKVAAHKSQSNIDLGVADNTFPRIDAIVIQFDANENETKIVHKIGVASSSPIEPEIVRTESIYELHLCQIYRPAGAVSITWNDVTDLRLSETHCGLMADSVTTIDTSAMWEQIQSIVYNSNQLIEDSVEEKLTAAKESGEFDGPPGQDGAQGEPGADGKDATINGENVLQVVGGAGIDVSTSSGTMTIKTNYEYGTEDLIAGTSALENGKLYFVYE